MTNDDIISFNFDNGCVDLVLFTAVRPVRVVGGTGDFKYVVDNDVIITIPREFINECNGELLWGQPIPGIGRFVCDGAVTLDLEVTSLSHTISRVTAFDFCHLEYVPKVKDVHIVEVQTDCCAHMYIYGGDNWTTDPQYDFVYNDMITPIKYVKRFGNGGVHLSTSRDFNTNSFQKCQPVDSLIFSTQPTGTVYITCPKPVYLHYFGNTVVKSSTSVTTPVCKRILGGSGTPAYYTCPVSYAIIEDSDPYYRCTNCTNYFSTQVESWIHTNNTCPMCRHRGGFTQMYINL